MSEKESNFQVSTQVENKFLIKEVNKKVESSIIKKKSNEYKDASNKLGDLNEEGKYFTLTLNCINLTFF